MSDENQSDKNQSDENQSDMNLNDQNQSDGNMSNENTLGTNQDWHIQQSAEVRSEVHPESIGHAEFLVDADLADGELQTETETQPPTQLKAKRGMVAVLIAGMLGGAIGSAGTFYAFGALNNGKLTTVDLNQSAADSSTRPDGSIAALAAAVTPAVVSIDARNKLGSATGTGFIIDSNGYIVTNNHVIADAVYRSTITVTLADGQEFVAKVVGNTSEYDIAVLKIQATGLPVVELGNSDGVVVGDTVIAIGSPLGLQSTVTSGIISALDRPVTTGNNDELSFIDALQTDAAINPGNSGGPLIDAKGRVIGVNSAIATNTNNQSEAGSIGLGFAIPINLVTRIAQEIIDTGEATIPIMGIELAIQTKVEGAVIQGITKGGPAAKSGLKVGDVIVKANGRTIHSDSELVIVIRSQNPGDVVEVETDAGKTYNITLGSK
jgi:putative serine protease PepD